MEFAKFLLTYLVGISIGIAILLVLVVASYMLRAHIKRTIYFIWSKVAMESYATHLRREEAERGFKEREE
jgi:uncharacterized membrane protein